MTETDQQNSKRQGGLGITGVLGSHFIALIDFTVSDGGSSKPGAASAERRNADAKRANSVGDKARFTGILEKQLIVPSWDAMPIGGA